MNNDVIEISYTGDLLAHRRCARAWAYQNYANFHPYEQVQAMEGRLIHHAMEWLTNFRKKEGRHANRDELEKQLNHYFRVLWARGIRTAFTSKSVTVKRVLDNLFPLKKIHPTVVAAVEGAQHTEYELRTVRKLIPLEHNGKSRLLLTGILDLVIQQQEPLSYKQVWRWTDPESLKGKVFRENETARPNDLEIWDYKGTRANDQTYLYDYIMQLLTYANLYKERTGQQPVRCVIFFVNEPNIDQQLLAIQLDDNLLEIALDWTIKRVKELQETIRNFRDEPTSVLGGDKINPSTNERTISPVLRDQCTACGQRFDCRTYLNHLERGENHDDVRLNNVFKN